MKSIKTLCLFTFLALASSAYADGKFSCSMDTKEGVDDYVQQTCIFNSQTPMTIKQVYKLYLRRASLITEKAATLKTLPNYSNDSVTWKNKYEVEVRVEHSDIGGSNIMIKDTSLSGHRFIIREQQDLP